MTKKHLPTIDTERRRQAALCEFERTLEAWIGAGRWGAFTVRVEFDEGQIRRWVLYTEESKK